MINDIHQNLPSYVKEKRGDQETNKKGNELSMNLKLVVNFIVAFCGRKQEGKGKADGSKESSRSEC